MNSAHGWREVLDPVVARYRGRGLRCLLRGDAAFALPDVYEYLEPDYFPVRDPPARQPGAPEPRAHLLTRPVGRPPHYVRRFYASVRYRAQSWSPPRQVVAKAESHPGELLPRVGFIVTDLHRPAKSALVSPKGDPTSCSTRRGTYVGPFG